MSAGKEICSIMESYPLCVSKSSTLQTIDFALLGCNGELVLLHAPSGAVGGA